MNYRTLENPLEKIVEVLITAMEAREVQLRRRAERVAEFSLQIAQQMGLSDDDCFRLHQGSLLHDIGNIGIPDAILLKPTGLSDWEFQEIKLHPIIGEQICKSLPSLGAFLPLIRSHHEKLDGSGYPDGLSGEAIPILVRILSVSDVYHTLRSERAFRPSYTHDEAMEILQNEVQHGWWDGDVVHHLARLPAPEPLRLD